MGIATDSGAIGTWTQRGVIRVIRIGFWRGGIGEMRN